MRALVDSTDRGRLRVRDSRSDRARTPFEAQVARGTVSHLQHRGLAGVEPGHYRDLVGGGDGISSETFCSGRRWPSHTSTFPALGG